MVKPLELTGQTFGSLTVLKRLDNGNYGRTLWLCQCSCGSTPKSILGSALVRGSTITCGCGRGKHLYNALNLVGLKFGALLVKADSGKRSNQSVLWECVCACGNSALVTSYALNKGITKSCGCLKNRPGVQSPLFRGVGELSKSQYSAIKLGAQKRKIEFSITIEEMWQKFIDQHRKCALSGIELSFQEHHKVRTGTASLDRIDSSKGYTVNNVQWVHKELNRIKLDVPNDRFIHWCKLVAKYKES